MNGLFVLLANSIGNLRIKCVKYVLERNAKDQALVICFRHLNENECFAHKTMKMYPLHLSQPRRTSFAETIEFHKSTSIHRIYATAQFEKEISAHKGDVRIIFRTFCILPKTTMKRKMRQISLRLNVFPSHYPNDSKFKDTN